MNRWSRALSLALLVLLCGTAIAQQPGDAESTAEILALEDVTDALTGAASEIIDPPGPIDSGDTAFMLIASALVLLMTPGLAFFYGGLVRRKNMLSVLMQCFTCMCLMTVLWVVVGYSLAFGSDLEIGPPWLHGIVGNPMDHLFLKGVGLEANGTIPHVLFMIFQGMFAIITPALIIGAFAERMKFSAFCVFSTLWLLLVYCPVCHWVWGSTGEGFWSLKNDGALDFAGGTVVHINAGIAALMTALVLGRRAGFPTKISPPHNLPFALLGAGLLWVGWFGFNAGSALRANETAANAFVVTHIAAAAAGLTWAVIEWLRGRPTVLGIITGAVAGLVAITPACGFVGPMGALGIGAGGAFLAYIAVAFIKEAVGYDDSLDVWGVHGIAGIWGAIATGIFAVESIGDTAGLIEGNAAQIKIQLKAVIYTLVYSGVASLILLLIVRVFFGLRAGLREEQVGLDMTEHAEVAYTVLD